MIYTGLIRPALCVNHDHHIVRIVAADTPNHGLSILLVPADIDEGQDLLTFLHDLTPSQRTKFALVGDMTLGVKTQNLLRDRRSSASQDFMFVSKHKLTRGTSSIVFFPADQHSKERALTRTLTPKDCYLYVKFDALNLRIADLGLTYGTIVTFLHLIDLEVCVQISGHDKDCSQGLLHLINPNTLRGPVIFDTNHIKSLPDALLLIRK